MANGPSTPLAEAEFVPLADQMSRGRLWLVLATLTSSLFMSALNQQIVATATPRIVADLGGFHLLAWMFTIYMLTSTIVSPIVGKLSDIFGRKLFVLTGMIIFVLASAGCGFATSMPMLILFRGIQGVGGGLVQSSVITTMGDLFSPAQRAKYIVIFMGSGAVASLSGPTVGGIVTDQLGWRWCFLLSLPVAAIAFAFVLAYLPSRKRRQIRPKIDLLGAGLLAIAASTLLLALVWAQKEYGWQSAQTVGMFATAALFTVLLVLQERRHPEAILPVHLFRNRDFVVGTVVFALMGCASQGTIAYLPTFVQVALGASATASGLITTPQALASLLGGFVGGQLLSRTGRYRWQVVIGLTIVLTATTLLQTLRIGDPTWHVSVSMVILGFGSGVVISSMSVVVLNSVSHQYIGVATGSRQFFSQIGVVLSTAIFGVILASSYSGTFEENLSSEAQATLPASVTAKFDDPTLTLDKRSLDAVKAEVVPLAGGLAALDSAVAASREAVATASSRIFLGASVITLIALFFAVIQRELPIRGRRPASEEAPFVAVPLPDEVEAI